MTEDKYASKRFDIQPEEAIDVGVLEAIPFEYPGSATEATYETEEFTAVCPWTGLPDFARLVITYEPDKKLVDEIFKAAKQHNRVLTEEELEELVKFHSYEKEDSPVDTVSQWNEQISSKDKADR